MDDLLITFIVALISMVIGYLISAVVRTASNKETETHQASVSPQVEDRLQKVGIEPDQLEVAVFYRELPDGVVKAKMDGKIILEPSELSIEQRRRLIQLITDLKPWLVPGSRLNQAPLSTYQTSPVAIAPDLKQVPVGVPSAIDSSSKSIVTQIDDILQEQTTGTPLAKRGLRIIESAGHGVIVWVGPKSYDGIENVPDPEIKSAIRKAVKTWEEREG